MAGSAPVFDALWLLVGAAVPVVALMGIWALVMAVRLVAPERPLPLDGPSRRERARRRGESRPVTLRQIQDDEARRRRRERQLVGGAPPSWADDLWLRRN